MKCVKCNGELRDGAKFCDLCGVAQPTGPAKCVKCGTELSDGAEFCCACGAPQSNRAKAGLFVVGSIVSGASYAVLSAVWWIVLGVFVYSHYECMSVSQYRIIALSLGLLSFLSSHLCVACGSVALYKRRWVGIIGIAVVAFVWIVNRIMFNWGIDWIIKGLR